MLVIFSYVIYEMGKCAVGESDERVVECDGGLDVCGLYVLVADAYNSTYYSFPIRRIWRRVQKVEKGGNVRLATEGDIQRYKELVEDVRGLGDFRNVVVTLIASASRGNYTERPSAHVSATLESLASYNWSKIGICT